MCRGVAKGCWVKEQTGKIMEEVNVALVRLADFSLWAHVTFCGHLVRGIAALFKLFYNI